MMEKPQLRKLFDSMFRTASDLDAFLIDYFEKLHMKALSDTDRVAKINRILIEVPPNELMSALRRHDPIALSKEISNLGISINEFQVTNPFQRWGTLPADSYTYIKRKCDVELAQIVRPNTRLSVFGEPQIGKSSLLNKFRNEQTADCSICYISFEDMITHDCKIFHDRFFRRLGRELESNVIDWDSLAQAIKKNGLILLIDELGLLTDSETIEQFIPRLLRFCDTYLISLITCMPISISQYFDKTHIKNPKYCSGWSYMEIPCFQEHELMQLLEFLPKRSKILAKKNIRTIARMSRNRPQAVQKLCYELYDIEENEASDVKLLHLINSKNSY